MEFQKRERPEQISGSPARPYKTEPDGLTADMHHRPDTHFPLPTCTTCLAAPLAPMPDVYDMISVPQGLGHSSTKQHKHHARKQAHLP